MWVNRRCGRCGSRGDVVDVGETILSRRRNEQLSWRVAVFSLSCQCLLAVM